MSSCPLRQLKDQKGCSQSCSSFSTVNHHCLSYIFMPQTVFTPSHQVFFTTVLQSCLSNPPHLLTRVSRPHQHTFCSYRYEISFCNLIHVHCIIHTFTVCVRDFSLLGNITDIFLQLQHNDSFVALFSYNNSATLSSIAF